MYEKKYGVWTELNLSGLVVLLKILHSTTNGSRDILYSNR